MRLVSLGASLALVGVALGAFGAHGLRGKVAPELLTVYQTGVQYHQFHALGVLLVGLLADRGLRAKAVPGLFLAGIVLFSGSLYLMALTGLRWLGAITPLGGICFLTGWAWLAVAAFRAEKERGR